jgi:hypothetical protein
MSIMEDTQAYVRDRAKLEMEHAANLQRLAQHYHNKRKWPTFTYCKGHDNILMIDLWRSVVNLGMEDAKARAIGADQLAVLAGEIFDKGKDEKKASFKTAVQMLVSLQEELHKLDGMVAETKSKYDASRKAFDKAQHSRKAKINTPANIKKAESSFHFARHE